MCPHQMVLPSLCTLGAKVFKFRKYRSSRIGQFPDFFVTSVSHETNRQRDLERAKWSLVKFTALCITEVCFLLHFLGARKMCDEGYLYLNYSRERWKGVSEQLSGLL